jgi:hypothetical protein
MNIGAFPRAWSTIVDPQRASHPPLPMRHDQPLTIDQLMDLADAVAHAG